MNKKNINILKYIHNKFKNNRGIKRIIFILSITMVVPLVFGLSFLALRSNNEIVSESVKHYRKSQTDIIKAELEDDMSNIISTLNSYYRKQEDNNLTKISAQQLGISKLSTLALSSNSTIYWIESEDKQLVDSNLTTDNQITNRDDLQDEKGVYYVNKIFSDVESKENAFNNFYFIDSKTNKVADFTTYSTKYTPWNWVITVGISTQSIHANVNAHEATLKNISTKKTLRMLILGISFGILLLIFSTVYATNLTKNVSKILNIAQKMETGDLSHRLSIKSKDELNDTSNALNIALEKISELINSINNISSTLDASVNSFAQNHIRMNSSIENVSGAIINITHNVGAQAQSTVEVSANIDEISTSIQNTVNEINILEDNSNSMLDYSDKSYTSIQKLIEINDRTKKDIDKMYDHTELTNNSVTKISNAAELINDIASQTNLLSLNASIEAARAGEHGKGFSVVASEIGVLASQSAKTVNEINSILNELNINSLKSIEIMNEMKNASNDQNKTLVDTSYVFNDLKDALNVCAASIRNITTMINDINNKKENILNNVTQLSSLSEKNAASTEETTAMTEDLTEMVSNSSEDIKRIANEFETLNKNLMKFKI